MQESSIPEEFRALDNDIRFIKVKKHSKLPEEEDWPGKNNYSSDDPRLTSWIEGGGNWGYFLKPDTDLKILDADNPDKLSEVIEYIGPTLTVKSGRDGSGYHILFRCGYIGNRKIYLEEPETHAPIGDIRPGGTKKPDGSPAVFQCVGPGSYHPDTGRKYAVYDASPPVELDADALLALIEPYRKTATKQSGQRLESSTIVEGGRNDYLTKWAGKLRGKGTGVFDTLSELRIINARDCNPPLPDEEIVLIAQSSAKWEPGFHRQPTESEVAEIVGPAKSRTLSQVAESGAYWYKQKGGISECSDLNQALWEISVYLLHTGATSVKVVSILTDKTNKLDDAVRPSLADIQSIKTSAYTYIAYTEMLLQSSISVIEISDTIKQKAEALIKSGEVYEEFIRLYRRFHASDERIAEIILLGYILQASEDPDIIIHPCLDGERGSGKSSGVDAALHLLPPEFTVINRFSPKSLYYDTIRERSVIRLDEFVWNVDFGSAVKSYMNDVGKPETYKTLDKDHNLLELRFPRCCMMIMTAVGDQADDQLIDRMYRIGVSKSPDKRNQHISIVLGEMTSGRSRRLYVDERIEVMREALRMYRKSPIRVVMPEAATRLKYVDTVESRDIEMFKLFLRGVCIMHYCNRPREMDGNVAVITSAGDDFKTDVSKANALFDTNRRSRQKRLNGSELKVADALLKMSERDGTRIYLNDLITFSKLPESTVRTAISGRVGIGGLVSKIDGMYTTKESFNTGDKTTHRTIVAIPENFEAQLNTESFGVCFIVD